MLSKQRNRLLIYSKVICIYLTKMSSNISKFVKAAKHIHHIELGTMVCIDFFK